MNGQDFQDRLDAIVEDLQTKGKGQTVQIALRGGDNISQTFELSSDAQGAVDANQLSAVQNFIDDMKPLADAYTGALAPVSAASEAFRIEREGHRALIDAYAAARDAMNFAFNHDAAYQAARAALEAAQTAPAYVAARDAYRGGNVSENYGNLQEARGKYLA